MRAVQGLPVSWGPVVATLNFNIRDCVVWSPCSRFIIARDGGATILDAVTLKQLSTLDIGCFSHFCPTPDSHFLAEFWIGTITKWDLQTGCPIGTIDPAPDQGPLDLDSYTYSTDGKLLAVKSDSIQLTLMTYNLFSMTYSGPYYPPSNIMNPIWTHGECLRFATRKPGCITIWEMEFTLIGPPVEVGSLQVPTETDGEKISDYTDFLFLPIVSRIAFSLQDSVFIWDAEAVKFLLKSGPLATPALIDYHGSRYIEAKSFSSSGHIFACMAADKCVRVYKEFPTGYVLHQQFTLYGIPARISGELCVSPNGESIIAYPAHKVYLWHTRDPINPISNSLTHGNPGKDLLLEFSPNQVLAAFVQRRGDTVTVLNLQSSNPPLTINVGMEVWQLAVMDSAIITATREEVATWDILIDNSNYDIGGKVTNGVHIKLPPLGVFKCLSVPHNLSYILILLSSHNSSDLWVLDGSTKRHIGGISTTESLKFAQFSPDGCEIQAVNHHSDHTMRWKIVKDSKSGSVELESLGEIPFILPWQSSFGYEVVHDCWVLGPTKERLLWLPHQWRSVTGYGIYAEQARRWSGQFFGLAHNELSEVVIVEFLK